MSETKENIIIVRGILHLKGYFFIIIILEVNSACLSITFLMIGTAN